MDREILKKELKAIANRKPPTPDELQKMSIWFCTANQILNNENDYKNDLQIAIEELLELIIETQAKTTNVIGLLEETSHVIIMMFQCEYYTGCCTTAMLKAVLNGYLPNGEEYLSRTCEKTEYQKIATVCANIGHTISKILRYGTDPEKEEALSVSYGSLLMHITCLTKLKKRNKPDNPPFTWSNIMKSAEITMQISSRKLQSVAKEKAIDLPEFPNRSSQ